MAFQGGRGRKCKGFNVTRWPFKEGRDAIAKVLMLRDLFKEGGDASVKVLILRDCLLGRKMTQV